MIQWKWINCSLILVLILNNMLFLICSFWEISPQQLVVHSVGVLLTLCSQIPPTKLSFLTITAPVPDYCIVLFGAFCTLFCRWSYLCIPTSSVAWASCYDFDILLGFTQTWHHTDKAVWNRFWRWEQGTGRTGGQDGTGTWWTGEACWWQTDSCHSSSQSRPQSQMPKFWNLPPLPCTPCWLDLAGLAGWCLALPTCQEDGRMASNLAFQAGREDI